MDAVMIDHHRADSTGCDDFRGALLALIMALATPTAPLLGGRASVPETMGMWAYPVTLSGGCGDPGRTAIIPCGYELDCSWRAHWCVQVYTAKLVRRYPAFVAY